MILFFCLDILIWYCYHILIHNKNIIITWSMGWDLNMFLLKTKTHDIFSVGREIRICIQNKKILHILGWVWDPKIYFYSKQKHVTYSRLGVGSESVLSKTKTHYICTVGRWIWFYFIQKQNNIYHSFLTPNMYQYKYDLFWTQNDIIRFTFDHTFPSFQ